MSCIKCSCKGQKSSQKEVEIFAEERWYLRWRHLAAYIFLIICLFDFIIMPAIYERNDKMDPLKAVELSLKFKDPATQSLALQTMLAKRSWTPLTLDASGMFFVAFGAILGAAAFTRGQEKVVRAHSDKDFRGLNRRNRVDSPENNNLLES